MGPTRCKADVPFIYEEGRDERDVRQMGAAAEGVVQDPRVAFRVAFVLDRRNRLRHRAEMHRYVLRLHGHLASG